MNNEQEDFTPEEQLRNETEILKLKLEVENNAIIYTPEGSVLPAELEHKWFKHIYDYERLCKEAGYTTVYDFIGKPDYINVAEIPADELRETLEQLLKYMSEKGVELDFEYGCYAPSTLYTFIIDELFQQEVCRYRGENDEGRYMFSYEEFHPNHQRDIFHYTMDFLHQLFGDKNWEPTFLKFTHEDSVTLNGKTLSLEKYSERIFNFKELYPSFLFSEPKIDDINFDLETKKTTATGTIEMPSKIVPYVIHFVFSYDLWTIAGLELELITEDVVSDKN